MPLPYPELFGSMERARWRMADDVPWDRFDAAALTDEQALTIEHNAITEWSALPATEMFLRDDRDDDDSSAFMSIWSYEERPRPRWHRGQRYVDRCAWTTRAILARRHLGHVSPSRA